LSINEETGPLLYTRGEAAEQLRVTTRTVDDLIRSGKLPAVKFGRRVLVRSDDLRELAKTGHNGRISRKQ
jgi:excisionase family DNA binding protein